MEHEYAPSPEIINAILKKLEDSGDFSPACLEYVESCLMHENQEESYKTPILPPDSSVRIREESPWFNREEAADYLGFKDPKSIDRLREKGNLKTYYPGSVKCPRFKREDLNALMA